MRNSWRGRSRRAASFRVKSRRISPTVVYQTAAAPARSAALQIATLIDYDDGGRQRFLCIPASADHAGFNCLNLQGRSVMLKRNAYLARERILPRTSLIVALMFTFGWIGLLGYGLLLHVGY